jgi:hypothetical protein
MTNHNHEHESLRSALESFKGHVVTQVISGERLPWDVLMLYDCGWAIQISPRLGSVNHSNDGVFASFVSSSSHPPAKVLSPEAIEEILSSRAVLAHGEMERIEGEIQAVADARIALVKASSVKASS